MALLPGLAACDTAEDSSGEDDGPILSGIGDMPKVLVTVWFSPTPDAASLAQTPVLAAPLPTATPEPLEPTLTPTPYVGVYIGTQTNGTPAPNYIPPLAAAPSSPGSLPVATVPVFLGGAPTGSAGSNCTVAVASSFANAYRQNASLAQQLGCPRDPGYSLTMVYQPFEHGQFFWRESKEIYALRSDGRYQRVIDTFQDGQPESDPAFAPPAGLLQPVRGFGQAWRSNEALRNAVGWALQSEFPYASYWQDFERGFMLVGNGGQVFALIPSDPIQGAYLGPLVP
jgi:hypothetical protein